MSTTIQIDKETKKKLFQLKLKLEKEKESSISYNEIINFLLNNQKEAVFEKINMEGFRQFEGIIPKSIAEDFWKERKEQLNKEERNFPLRKKN